MSEELEAGTPVASPSAMAGHGIASALPSLGTQLRVAREAKGNSIADVVQVIRFSAHQIEALERDDYGSLPGATSVRGLVRNYAKFLKLDPLPLLALIEPAVPVPEADVRPPTNMGEAEQPGLAERVPSRLLSAVVGVLVLFAALYWYLDPSSESTVVKRTVPPATVAPAVPVVVGDAGSAVSLATPAAPLVGGGSAVAAVESSPPLATGGLHIEFDDRSWIEIRDASRKVVLAGEYSAGTRQDVDGKPPYQIWIGRASGVRVFLGERRVDLKPHTREEVARFTLE